MARISANVPKVCKARPQYEKGGKTYPTCGLTCAAKLNPQEKCEVSFVLSIFHPVADCRPDLQNEAKGKSWDSIL